MKKKKLIHLAAFCAIGVLLLSGCDNKKIESALDKVKHAGETTAKIKKGEFEFTYQLEDGDKNAKKVNQKVIGTFEVKEDKKINWTRKIYIAEEDTPRAEQKQEEGIQYQKVEEDNQWIPINENAVSYPPEMEQMIKIDWKAEDIEKAETVEEDGGSAYHFEFSEEYLKNLKQEEVKAIQKELKVAKEDSSSDEEYLKGLEASIKDYEAINYTEYKVEIKTGDRGELDSMKTQITTVNSSEKDKQESVVTTEVSLTDFDYEALQE